MLNVFRKFFIPLPTIVKRDKFLNKTEWEQMKQQRYAVIVLFAMIIASSLTSIGSYNTTERLVSEDMAKALALALEEQQSDVINQDTIRTFNSHLQIAELRGKATLAVNTREQKFKAYAHCSEATIFSLSDQRPATVLWVLTGFWEMFFQSPSHSLTKTEICNALWPKKPDASETLYTLIRRLKPVIEQHSDLKIESGRSKAYRLEIK